MSIIGCDDCGGYYELEEGESLEDFECCQCGGTLKHVVFGALETESFGAEEIAFPLATENQSIRKSTIFDASNRRFDRFSSDLSYAEPAHEVSSQKVSNKNKKFIQCGICGQIHKSRAIICSKCGNILRNKNKSSNPNDYQHVLEQSKKKRFLDRVEWWGIASGIIFLIVVWIITSIMLFGGLMNIAMHNANESALAGFLGGSALVSVLIMIFSGFVAVATIKSRDYITGMINGGLVGVFIGIFAGTFALIFIALFAGILGQEDAGIIGGLAVLIGDVIIYGALTAFGGLIATYVRRHTPII